MKITGPILTFLLFGFQSQAQVTEYDMIPVKTPEECKAAESKVIEAANLVLSKPLKGNDNSISKARTFIIVWMSNTNAYTFTINENITKLTKNNELLFGIYLSCIAKYALENPAIAKDETKVQLGSYTLLAAYIEEKKNGVEVTKQVQKFLNAKKAGKLEEYIGK